MQATRKTKITLRIPWHRTKAEALCAKKNFDLDVSLVELYIKFFLREVVVHNLLYLDWKEASDTSILVEVFDEDLTDVFEWQLSPDWQISLMMCEYLFSIYGKLGNDPVKQFVSHWCARNLSTLRKEKPTNNQTHNHDTSNRKCNDLGDTGASVCRAGSDD